MCRYFLGMVKYIWWLKWIWFEWFQDFACFECSSDATYKRLCPYPPRKSHPPFRTEKPSQWLTGTSGQVDNEGGWSWGGFLVQPCDHVTVMKVFTKIVTPRSPSVTCNFWEVTHGSGNDRQFFVTLAKVFATWTQKRFAHISSARWLRKCRNGSHKEALVSSQK